MQSVTKIKNEINQLSFPFKVELLRYTKQLVEREAAPKFSLAEAAELMVPYYMNDKELSEFSQFESDFYEEG